jgi:hypothetical protein
MKKKTMMRSLFALFLAVFIATSGFLSVKQANAATFSILSLTNFPYLLNVGTQATYQLTVDNPSNVALSYILSPTIAGATVDQNGLFTWTPTEGQQGVYALSFTATDGVNFSNTAVITVQVDNALPGTISPIPVFSTPANNWTLEPGQSIAFYASATSPIGNPIILSATLLPGATFNPSTGLYSWTASTTDVGNTYTFDITATDGTNSAVITNSVTIIPTPTPTPTPTSTHENKPEKKNKITKEQNHSRKSQENHH